MILFPDIQLPPMRMMDIERAVCSEYDLHPFVIRLKSRVTEHVAARHEFMLRANKHYSQTEIADYLGMHPSTVSDAIKTKIRK